MTLPFGVDISKYQYGSNGQQKPDFDRLNAAADFVGVRAGISWGYADPWFGYSWQHITKPRLAYHVMYPGESAQRQMEHFLRIVNPSEHDRLVLDVELDHGCSKAQITKTLLDCLQYLLGKTGRYPIVYSRANWINQFVNVADLPQLDWWLAHYLKRRPDPLYTPEKDPPPALPDGVSNWLIHQTAERGNGSAVGVVSHYVDTNRFNGTQQELLAYFGLTEEVPPEPEPPVEKLFDARVITTPPNRLKTRYTPNGNARPEGDWLQSGAVTPVYETQTGWYRVEVETWASAQWLQRLDVQPPAVLDWGYYGPVYSQRDIRWASHPLGTRSTIGAHGCLMTCAPMVCNAFGHASNPRQLNEWCLEYQPV